MKTTITKVWIEGESIFIQTSEGEVFSENFADYPRLRYATLKQRANFEYDNIGIHWEELDEDLSYDGFTRKEADHEKTPIYKAFKTNPEINASSIARRIGIPQSVMAAYICGIKKPSEKRKREIEKTLHQIGESLLAVKL